jgi:uncharacterized protein (TIGR03435 family)
MQKVIVSVLGTGLAAMLFAQTPQFEVASVKILPPGEPQRARTSDKAFLHYPSASLLSLLREAYRLKRPEQVDGPAWMEKQLYAVEAKLPSDAPRNQIPEMLQTLLAERFKLSVHHEMRPMPTNVLLPGKKGTKMRSVTEPGDGLVLNLEGRLVHLSGPGSITDLLDQLNHGLGGQYPWADMTGLSGLFQIKLDFDMFTATPENMPSLPGLPEALGEQLGLRVEVRNLPTDIVVVDHVEKTPVNN